MKTKKATIFTYWRWKLVDKMDAFVARQIDKDNRLSDFWEKVYVLTDRLSGYFQKTYCFVREQVHIEGNRYYDRDAKYEEFLKNGMYIKTIFKEYPEYTINE